MSEYLLITANPPLEDVIKHYGVKGMKWGVRRDRSKGDDGGSERTKPRFTPAQKKVARNVAIIGASATATILAGPVAGVAVSSLGRILNEVGDVTRTTETITVDNEGSGRLITREVENID